MAEQTVSHPDAPIEFEADFDQATMKRMEDHAQAKVHGQHRRAALATLTRSKAQLKESLRDDEDAQEAFLELAEALSDEIKHAEAVVSVLKSAEARILVVLSEIAEEQEAESANG